jgi:2-dehydro-3-deoxyphosphogluconate aldolase / (4S)-4-hydroxy-2-oxoglutarate aldolase
MSPTQLDVATLAPSRIIPVVVIDDALKAERLREALKAGGLNCAEITFRTSAAGDAIQAMAEDPDFIVGAGTVVSAAQADFAMALGARFVISPGVSKDVVHGCQSIGIPVFPGVVTPTEVLAALELGLTELKFFPAATAGGVPAIKALGGPFHTVRFVPTGGISAANAGDYLALPNVAALGGTWLTPTDALVSGDFERITQLTAAAVDLARRVES